MQRSGAFLSPPQGAVMSTQLVTGEVRPCPWCSLQAFPMVGLLFSLSTLYLLGVSH